MISFSLFVNLSLNLLYKDNKFLLSLKSCIFIILLNSSKNNEHISLFIFILLFPIIDVKISIIYNIASLLSLYILIHFIK